MPQSTSFEQHPDSSQPTSTDYDLSLDYMSMDDAVTSGLPYGQVPLLDDWLWDMVINDGNMFTLGES